MKRRKPAWKPVWPDIKTGHWKGEMVGSCTVSFGQDVQPGPPRQSIEFTYMVIPAIFTMPEAQYDWPGIIMIMVPTPMKTEFPDAGRLIKGDGILSLLLSLEVTRGQFTDMLGMIERKRLKEFRFTTDEQDDDCWSVKSWGMTTTFS